METSPILAVPYLDSPPVIDGRLESAVWDRAACFTGFLDATSNLATRQTTAMAGFDEENLYLAFVSHNPAGIQAEVTEQDTPKVMHDDAFEVYLQPDPAKEAYVLLAGNALGTQYDAKGKDGTWNAEWKLACEREYDSYFVAATWTAELAIPFRSLGLAAAPADGTAWRANFCRDWTRGLSADERTATGRYTTWSPVGGNFHSPSRFGTLKFSRTSPAIRLTAFGDLTGGSIELEGLINASSASEVVLEWNVRPTGDPAEQVVSGRLPVKITEPGSAPFRLDGELRVPGTEAWPVALELLAVDANAEDLYRQSIPYAAIPPFRVEIKPLYLRGFVAAEFDVTRMPELPIHAVGRVALLADAGRVVSEAELPQLGVEKQATLQLDISGVEPGSYRLKVLVEDAGGTELSSRTESFVLPAPPKWQNNHLGISDKVPPPYTDLSASDRSVDVWGRTYSLGENLLPEQIEILGTGLLAGPMQLFLADERGQMRWDSASSRLKHAAPAQAAFEISAANEVVQLRGSMQAEYDGFLLFEFDFEPVVPEGSFSELVIEVPLHRRLTPFLRASRVPVDRWAAPESIQHALIGDVRAERVPEGFSPGYSPDGWRWGDEFIPQFWVGDDFRGLLFFMDSQEHMHWEGSPLEVVEQGDVTLLRVVFINRPTALKAPLHYRFAFQATPVRKRERRMERLSYGFDHLWNEEKINEAESRQGMIQAAVLWNFGRVEKDYVASDPDRFRQIVSNWRSHGIELLVNIGSGFFVEGEDEYQRYGPEWRQEPLNSYPNHGGTDVSLVKVCPRSSFADYFLWWLKDMIEEYGIGGIYLDLSGPVGCANRYHGCGYETGGERGMTAEQFECREFYKRCYTFLKEEGAKRGREFYIFQHSAEGAVTPFVDMMTKGEGWSAADTFETLTPTYFRAVESWRHLGVPYTFFPTVSMPGYRKGKHRAPHREPLACALVHDVLTVSHWKEQVEEDLLPIWLAWEAFDMDDALWVPYFQNDPRVSTSAPEMLSSFYIGEKRLMVVVSNLTDVPAEGQLQIDRSGLDLPSGRLPVRDILSGDEMDLEGDTLSLRVEPKNLAVLRIN